MPDFPLPDSALLPTTQIYDIEQLEIKEAGLKEFLVQLTQTVNSIALMVNMKDTGYYFQSEFANSQYYFPIPIPAATYDTIQQPRAVFRKVVWWNKPLPNAGLGTEPHGIVGIGTNFRFTRIYGCASKPTVPYSYLPLPFASPTLLSNISLSVDATNVRIITGTNLTAFTSTFIVLEYIKES